MSDCILVIDDEPGISTALLVRLKAEGFSIVTASDGPSGLAAASRHRPRVILLDVSMPGMDGIEVCRHLKSDPQLRTIPVIFLTANATDELRDRAYAVGGVRYLSKPYESGALVKQIRSVADGATESD